MNNGYKWGTQILVCGEWKTGKNSYDTIDLALARINELAGYGIKARLLAEEQLFSNIQREEQSWSSIQ